MIYSYSVLRRLKAFFLQKIQSKHPNKQCMNKEEVAFEKTIPPRQAGTVC